MSQPSANGLSTSSMGKDESIKEGDPEGQAEGGEPAENAETVEDDTQTEQAEQAGNEEADDNGGESWRYTQSEVPNAYCFPYDKEHLFELTKSVYDHTE